MPATKRKPFEVVSNTGTEGRHARRVVEDVFIVLLNVVCVCVSSVVKCVTVLCGLPVFSLPLAALFLLSIPEWFPPNSSRSGINLKGEMERCTRTYRGRTLRIQPGTMKCTGVLLLLSLTKENTGRIFLFLFKFVCQVDFLGFCCCCIKCRCNIIDEAGCVKKTCTPQHQQGLRTSPADQICKNEYYFAFDEQTPTYVIFPPAKFRHG